MSSAPKRASEPILSHYVSTHSSDLTSPLDRQSSELRVIASHVQRPVSPNPTSVENPLGLTLVYCPPNPIYDLIFIHGLGGTSRGTWAYERDPRNFWPPWLAEDIGLSSCRTFTFGYNAAFAAQYSSAGILDFAKDLLFRMKTFSGESREDGPQIGKLPIAFVAHSMGGLVIKKAYIIGKSDPQYAGVVPRIRAMIFLATPHKGSQYADTLNNILKAVPQSGTKAYIMDLAQNSSALQDINEQFRHVCGDLQLISFHETKKTNLGAGFKRILVDKESSILGYPGEQSSSLVADHHGMTKFKNVQDSNYIDIRNALRYIVRDFVEEEEDQGDGFLLRRQSSSIPTTSGTILSSEVPTRERLTDLLGVTYNVEEELEYFAERTMEGTCQWLLSREYFRDWAANSSNASGILWLTGSPGSGKSTWASYAIGWLRRTRYQGTCQHHFFQAGNQHKRTISYFLRSLAFQIALAYENFSMRLLESCESTGITFGQAKALLIWERIFEGLLFPMSLEGPLFWVIDGLDESESYVELLKLLTKIRSSTKINILFFSRPSKEMMQDMARYLPTRVHEHIVSDDTFEDIGEFVRHSVRQILWNDPEDDMVETILRKAAGSFLWVKLALERIKNDWHTRDGIMLALTEVPEGMEPMYERMLDDIARRTPKIRAMATRILTWIVCSFRPLEVVELKAALVPEFTDFTNLASTVEEICGQFAVVNHRKVNLIHETARSFLLHKTSNLPLRIDGPLGHEHAAQTCIDFLSDMSLWRRTFESIQTIQHSRFAVDPLLPFEAHPFLLYALFYWSHHLRHAPVNSDDLLEKTLGFLETSCLLWINGIALTRNLRIFIKTAENLKTYLKRRLLSEKKRAPTSYGRSRDDQLRQWATDIVRVVGRFGGNLRQDPACIYKYVLPFCPEESIISRSFAHTTNSAFSVTGKFKSWDDCLARLSVGADKMATRLLCNDKFVVGLVGSTGTLVVWHAQTFEEIRRITHGEWVNQIVASNVSSLIATAGYDTIRVWNGNTGEELFQRDRKPYARALALAFDANDTELYIATDDCFVECVNMASGDTKWTFLAKEPGSDEYSCPRFMSFSPDLTRVVVVYRGKPVLVWKIRTPLQPKKCVRIEDRFATEGDALNSPEKALWSPDHDHVLILYEDTQIMYWNLANDQQVQYDHTAARAMALSPDGNLLLTSDVTGTLSIWTIPDFKLTYQLKSDELVQDLAFSADGTRFYDVHGSFCNVWESDILVRANEIDEDEMSSLPDTLTSDVVLASDGRIGETITALACDASNNFYCCGFDDGTVSIYDIATGKKARNKVISHEDTSSVIKLVWSLSEEYLASADDSSRIIAKRVEKPSKQKPKWAIFGLFDFRTDEAVEHLLFSTQNDLLLVKCPSTAIVMSLKLKREICRKDIRSWEGAMWLNHPLKPTIVMRISASREEQYEWKTLNAIEEPFTSSLSSLSLVLPNYIVYKAFLSRRKIWILEMLSYATGKRDFELLDFSRSSQSKPASRQKVKGLKKQISHLIGCLQDKVVFLDNDYWACTWDVEPTYSKHTRHFFLPKDLIGPRTLRLIQLNNQGTLLCPKGRDVIIIRSGLQF